MLADHLQKAKTGYKNSKKQKTPRYIYQNELDKAFLQRDMAYGAYTDLPIGTASDKVLCGKEFAFAGNPKYERYQ